MAHQLETHTTATGETIAAFAAARTPGWHQLGTVFTNKDALTGEEAMTAAHLTCWNIRKEPLTAQVATPDGGTITVPVDDRWATVRDNPLTGKPEALGVVGNAYRPIQNEEHVAFLNALVDEGGAVFDTAGSLDRGRRVFVTMRLPETIKVGGVDPVDLYLAAMNSHDGTSSFRVVVTPVRVVCANTERAALQNNRAHHAIRHTTNATKAVQEAREALDLTFAYLEEFEAEAERMIQETITDGEFFDIMGRLYGRPDARDASPRALAEWQRKEALLSSLWADAGTQEGVRGTRWAAYNVVTEAADWYSRVHGSTPDTLTRDRAERVMLGAQDALKQAAWELCRVPA